MILSKKLFLSSVVLLVLISYPSVAASSEMWSQTYGGTEVDEAYSLIETSDGGYALTGDGTLFVKTDEHGNVEWTRAYEGKSLVATSDGGYAIAGYKSSPFMSSEFRLIKIDAYGNLEWSKTYGGSETERAFSLVETPDGGFALVGETYSFSTIRSDFWLVKTDRYGNMEWNRTYGGPQFDVAHSVIVTSDGGFMIAGYKDYQANWVGAHFWLIKTDAYGNMLWNKTYSNMVDMAYCVIETADGGFALAGSTGFMTNTDIWVVKTDEYGNVEWNRTYGDGVARALVEPSDGGYALAGTKYNNFWLAKTDEYGVIPEFPSWTPVLVMVVALVAMIVVYRYNLKKLRGWATA